MGNTDPASTAGSLSANDAMTMTIARIDEQVNEHRMAISALHSERNSLLPVFRLPAEVLEVIFIDCAEHDHTTSEHHAVPDWVNISYVCRHWRKISLNCSALWGYLFTVSARWMDELFARSQRAPLRFSISLYSSSCPVDAALRALKQTMNHVERIQELRLELCDGDELALFPALLVRASHLQILKIHAGVRGSRWSSVLFDGDTPSLHTLDLSFCPVPWYLFKLDSLTTLRLVYPVPLQGNMKDFLTTLGSLQNLIHLELRLERNYPYIDDIGSSVAFQNFQKIILPCLSRILIITELPTLTALLSCIHIPTTAELRLQCARSMPPLDHYTFLISFLRQRLRDLEAELESPLTLVVRFWNVDQFQQPSFTAYPLSKHHPPVNASNIDTPWTGNPFLRMEFVESVHLQDNDRLVKKICFMESWTRVQRLDVENFPPSAAFWTETLRLFPNLRRLTLCSGPMPDLNSALSVTPHNTDSEGENGGGDRCSMLVPALEDLQLRFVKVSAVSQVETLFEALASRKETRGRATVIASSTKGTPRSVEIDGVWEEGRFDTIDVIVER